MDDYRNTLLDLIRPHAAGADIDLVTPPDPSMGDLALPCFPLARALRKAPPQIAAELANAINEAGLPDFVERIETKGPYLNIFLKAEHLVGDTLAAVREQGDAYGSSDVGRGSRVLIEHTSINPNASPHVGRARNAMIGDVLVRLFRFEGYDVEVQYFINDAGKQIAMLVLGAEECEELTFDSLLDLYVDINNRVKEHPELEKDVFALLKKFEDGDEETKAKFRRVVDTCIEGQTEILAKLGITYDVFQYESEYLWNGRTNEILELLLATGKLFEDPDSRWVLNQEGTEVPLESPYLVLARGDKTSLYPLRDLAYTIDKCRSGAERNVIVLGEDQKVYFIQLREALKLLDITAPDPVHYSFVLLSEGKMSTRKGTVVLLEDFMAEAVERARKAVAERHEQVDEQIVNGIAYGAVKYAILKVANNKNVTFDWETALSFEGDTGPYLQYSYARICSIFRKYGKALPEQIDPALLVEPSEKALVSELAKFPGVVAQAADELSPHILTNFVFGLTKAFSTFYHDCPVLNADSEDLTAARLVLIDATRQVIRNALGLLGIKTIETM